MGEVTIVLERCTRKLQWWERVNTIKSTSLTLTRISNILGVNITIPPQVEILPSPNGKGRISVTFCNFVNICNKLNQESTKKSNF